MTGRALVRRGRFFGDRLMFRPLSLVVLLALAIATPSLAQSQTVQRPRVPGATKTCECSCRSDEKRLLLSGAPIWKYSSTVTWTDSANAVCSLSDRHACQVTKPDGSKAPGTLAECATKTTTLTINPNKVGPNTPAVTVTPNRSGGTTTGR
jgi:hypothetical protein